MYLINSCASCAAPLEPTDVKKCSRCKTRYCSATCARDHWKKRGGHKTTCEEIAADGGAERSYVIAVRPLLEDFDEDLADQLASIVDSDDERDTLEFALAHQARRSREKKERREYNAKAVADFSRSQWKKGTRRKKVESPDAIVVP